MVGRDNAHIPKESWPSFTWYLIEFAIVFAAANLIAFQIIPMVDEMVGQRVFCIANRYHGYLNVHLLRKQYLIQDY